MSSADTYIVVMKDADRTGTIDFSSPGPNVSQFVARSATGDCMAAVTDTGHGIDVRETGSSATTACPNWQAAAETVFGAGIRLEFAQSRARRPLPLAPAI
jgi:hypothetical protein